ncbi:DUF5058 family protein [Kocuria sp. M1R5S2]|uniref:DUF5058 family protein n=1 Tax=Kocuria rhizosphaerae TaxID=3376285 RepID=UPI0037AEF9C5
MDTPPTAVHVAGSSTDILAVANSPFLWLCALGVFAVIAVQSLVYVRAARRAAPSIGMSARELNRSFRAGAVASIGPSLAVVLVAIALLALFGTPAVLMRIGLIGSAAAETASAGIASSTMGATLGGADYTQQVFAVAFVAMSISGGMWMLATLLFTPVLKRGGHRLSQVNPAFMLVIPAAALLGAFSAIAVTELPKSGVHAMTVLTSAAVMGGLLLLARRLHAPWLKEWALGIAIFVGLTVAFVNHTV